MPLPSEETTPPVMKMYLADFDSTLVLPDDPSTLTREHPRWSVGRVTDFALRRLAGVTPLALALVLVAAFAHAGWNALSKRAPGGAAFVWAQEAVGIAGMVPVAAAGIWLDDGARVSLAIVLMGIASGAAHTALLRAPAARLRDAATSRSSIRWRAARGRSWRRPARSRSSASDPGPLALAGTAAIAVGVVLLLATRGIAAAPRSSTPADRPADRHLHDLGRPRGARVARRAALLSPDHEPHDRRGAAARRRCASARPCGCCCATTAASSWPSACSRRSPTRSCCSRRGSPAWPTSPRRARSRS